jgi:hypothetical protein
MAVGVCLPDADELVCRRFGYPGADNIAGDYSPELA